MTFDANCSTKTNLQIQSHLLTRRAYWFYHYTAWGWTACHKLHVYGKQWSTVASKHARQPLIVLLSYLPDIDCSQIYVKYFLLQLTIKHHHIMFNTRKNWNNWLLKTSANKEQDSDVELVGQYWYLRCTTLKSGLNCTQ